MKNQLITKTIDASVAVKSLDEAGWLEGYASTFGNKDQVGDRILKGAFRRTLSHKGGKIPILLGHNRDMICGYNFEAAEDDYGLRVKGKLNLDTDAGRTAHFYLKSAKEAGGEGGLSIGFRVPNGSAKKNEFGGYDIDQCSLDEYSVTPWPCNLEAVITNVKQLDESIAPENEMNIELLTKALRGESADLTDEQKSFLTSVQDLIKKQAEANPVIIPAIKTEPIAEEFADEKDYDSGDDMQPMSFEESMDATETQQNLADHRNNIEMALHKSIGSIKGSSLPSSEKKMRIVKSLHGYADEMGSWHAKCLDMEAGPRTSGTKSEHEKGVASLQRKARAARVHLKDGHALVTAGHARMEKGAQMLHQVSRGLAPNDTNAPHPEGKSQDPNDISTKELNSNPETLHLLLPGLDSLLTTLKR